VAAGQSRRPGRPVDPGAGDVVRDQWETPKSEASERTIALGPVVAEALFARFAETAYQNDTDRAFCHPETGGPLDRKRYADTLRAALAKAKVEGAVRPFHDGRHSALTNGAAAGIGASTLQAIAGHADLSTTQRYIDLAGISFKAEVERAEARMFGAADAEFGSQNGSHDELD
jgi:integrase